jgi:hypothetical protein
VSRSGDTTVKNHTVRTEDWRYIRYANGDEELYDERSDPYEWTNLARNPSFAAVKAGLAKDLPTEDRPDISGGFPGLAPRKAARKKAAAQPDR